MSDVIYVLLTLAVFVLLSLLVGALDRHAGAAEPAGTPDLPADAADVADAAPVGRVAR